VLRPIGCLLSLVLDTLDALLDFLLVSDVTALMRDRIQLALHYGKPRGSYTYCKWGDGISMGDWLEVLV
jgi:hypothetical protein